MAKTYEAIATYTVSGSATATYTFSSIPATYTDLVIVLSVALTDLGGWECRMRLNGDTGTTYSNIALYSNGTTGTYRELSRNYFSMSTGGCPTDANVYRVYKISINNYSNSTTYKTGLSRSDLALGGALTSSAVASLWRSTAAINSVTIFAQAYNFAAGSTFTLYGIKSA